MFAAALLVTGTMLFTACTKKEDATPATTTIEKADDAAARNELDRVQDDIETIYTSHSYDSSGARTSAVDLPCGNVTLTGKNFSIAYGGVNCGSRLLSGTITVTLVKGTTFSDLDAVLKVVFNNYKVHYNASGQEIIYNGTTYVTNATGGKLLDVWTSTSADTLIHKVRGTLKLNYDTTGTGDTTVGRVWNLFRKKTFASGSSGSANGTGITYTFEGDTTISASTWLSQSDQYQNVCEYGIDAKGNKFVHTIPTSFKWSNCGTDYQGPYILKQGKVVHTTDANAYLIGYIFEYAATAGYKFNGATPTPDNTCSSDGYFLEVYAQKISDGTKPYYYSAYQQY
ncbi:MAG: hypothetical protein JWO58_1983 [Chitinophagaceae bacterium]|nr:hypothetical protein [Chitinophagaceae bacterium]